MEEIQNARTPRDFSGSPPGKPLGGGQEGRGPLPWLLSSPPGRPRGDSGGRGGGVHGIRSRKPPGSTPRAGRHPPRRPARRSCVPQERMGSLTWRGCCLGLREAGVLSGAPRGRRLRDRRGHPASRSPQIDSQTQGPPAAAPRGPGGCPGRGEGGSGRGRFPRRAPRGGATPVRPPGAGGRPKYCYKPPPWCLHGGSVPAGALPEAQAP